MKNPTVVTASEIGDYVYCRRSWWLKINGYIEKSNYAMERGTKNHNLLLQSLETASFKKVLAIVLIVTGLILLSLTITLLIL